MKQPSRELALSRLLRSCFDARELKAFVRDDLDDLDLFSAVHWQVSDAELFADVAARMIHRGTKDLWPALCASRSRRTAEIAELASLFGDPPSQPSSTGVGPRRRWRRGTLTFGLATAALGAGVALWGAGWPTAQVEVGEPEVAPPLARTHAETSTAAVVVVDPSRAVTPVLNEIIRSQHGGNGLPPDALTVVERVPDPLPPDIELAIDASTLSRSTVHFGASVEWLRGSPLSLNLSSEAGPGSSLQVIYGLFVISQGQEVAFRGSICAGEAAAQPGALDLLRALLAHQLRCDAPTIESRALLGFRDSLPGSWEGRIARFLLLSRGEEAPEDYLHNSGPVGAREVRGAMLLAANQLCDRRQAPVELLRSTLAQVRRAELSWCEVAAWESIEECLAVQDSQPVDLPKCASWPACKACGDRPILASLYERHGLRLGRIGAEWHRAAEHLEIALGLDPDSDALRLAAAEAWLHAVQPERAGELLRQRAIEGEPALALHAAVLQWLSKRDEPTRQALIRARKACAPPLCGWSSDDELRKLACSPTKPCWADVDDVSEFVTLLRNEPTP